MARSDPRAAPPRRMTSRPPGGIGALTPAGFADQTAPISATGGDGAVEVFIEDPFPFAEFLFGVLGLVVIIFIHGIGVRRITRMFNNHWTRLTPRVPAWHVNLLFGMVIAALVALHLFETLVFALVIWMVGLLPSLRDAYYFVMESYTTLGASLVELPVAWRLAGPIIGMAGLFTFGWTSSLLVSVMGDISRHDRAQAITDVRREALEEAPGKEA